MRLAIPTWEGRISPVFDVAKRVLVVDIVNGEETGRKLENLPDSTSALRTQKMEGLRIDVLICGAISSALEKKLARSGMQVVPYICGEVEQVLAALVAGRFESELFLMPGCSRRKNIGPVLTGLFVTKSSE